MKFLFLLSMPLLVSAGTGGDTKMFCATHALKAAEALANLNGSISVKEHVSSKDGKSFTVIFDKKDKYLVKTEGGHSCQVLSVLAKSKPTQNY